MEDDEQLIGIEKIMAGDDTGEATLALIQSLAEVAQPLKERMKGPTSPQEFQTTQELLQALEAGEEVLKSVWGQLHPSRSSALF